MTDDIFDFPSDIMFYPPFVPDDVHAHFMEQEVQRLTAENERLKGDLEYIAHLDCAEKNRDEDGTLGITMWIGGPVRVEVYLCEQHFDATDDRCQCGHELQPVGEPRCVSGCSYQADRDDKEQP